LFGFPAEKPWRNLPELLVSVQATDRIIEDRERQPPLAARRRP
jgi:hypothetical protein